MKLFEKLSSENQEPDRTASQDLNTEDQEQGGAAETEANDQIEETERVQKEAAEERKEGGYQ